MADKEDTLFTGIKGLKETLEPFRELQETMREIAAPMKEISDSVSGLGLFSPPSGTNRKPRQVIHKAPAPPVLKVKKRTSEQQRAAILDEIARRGWDAQAIPYGGVEDMRDWFKDRFKRSSGVFRTRWQELRNKGLIRNEKKHYNSKTK